MIYGKEIMTGNLNKAKSKLLRVLTLNRIEFDYQVENLCILEFKELKKLTNIRVNRKDLFSRSNVRLLFAGQYKNLSIDIIVYNGDIFRTIYEDEASSEEMLILLVNFLITYYVKISKVFELHDIEKLNIINEISICIAKAKPGESFKKVYDRLSSENFKFKYIDENSINILKLEQK